MNKGQDENDEPTPFGFSPFGASGPGGQGSPFEGQFGAPGMPDLNAMMNQFAAFLTPHEGAINWPAVIDLSRKQVAAKPDPSPSTQDKSQVTDALRLSDHWLNEHTSFPSGVVNIEAWSRAKWLLATEPVWHQLIEPIAASSRDGMSTALPEEVRSMGGGLFDMMSTATSALMAQQISAALASLADDILTVSDIGLPMGPAGTAALLPDNIVTFSTSLDVPADDVVLYLALREAAHHRLFSHVPWLRDQLVGAVAAYCAGMEIDPQALTERVQGIDPSDPAALQEALASGLFEPEKTPVQQAALEQLEITLALVEGWVDTVVTAAASAQGMPTAERLREIMRRRRATGGPAEQSFSAMVGLELRPRRLRDAATLWASLTSRQGIEARDGVWMHPQLLPTASDLDDPLSFREDAVAAEDLSEAEFDQALRDLLDGKE
jgi:putative hydrolase